MNERASCCSPSTEGAAFQQQIENVWYRFFFFLKRTLTKLHHLPSPRPAGATAAELVIKCTATGIQLQCHMKYYTGEMNITWLHG